MHIFDIYILDIIILTGLNSNIYTYTKNKKNNRGLDTQRSEKLK